MQPIPIYVGFDQREAVAYHTFCQSVLDHASVPVKFIPLVAKTLQFDGRRDGSNDFIYSRFLVPWLQRWQGWALFADGDMVCKADIAELWDLRDQTKAVMVCKHDYKTKAATKYLGNKNEDYPRKNWSSVILWNCGSFPNLKLEPEYVSKATGAHLHRFQWLQDERIGELPLEWNWLETEYAPNPKAKLIHYTLGTPCFPEYSETDTSNEWRYYRWRSQMPLDGAR